MTRRCLVYIYGPQHIIPAICAVRWFGSVKCNGEAEDVNILLHMPGLPDEIILKLQEIAINLTSALNWPEPRLITNIDVQTKIKPRFSRYKSVSFRFKELLGRKSFDEIYYPHDLVGTIVELCISSYPDAKRIIFGDGMGQLYSKKYLEFKNPQSGYMDLISVVKEKIINFLKGKPDPCSPNFVVAILPMDWSGYFLNNSELLVVPLHCVQEIISDCVRNIPDIESYIKFLLETTHEPRFLILLTNLSDVKLITPESEIALNLEIIYNNIPKKSSIIIKRHPLSRTSLEKSLKSYLSNDYDIHIISPEYDRYPVEIWNDLIINSNIISFASSCISIQYIFEKPVIYTMNEKTIRKFFPEKSWKLMEDAHMQYQSQLNNLATWDKKSEDEKA